MARKWGLTVTQRDNGFTTRYLDEKISIDRPSLFTLSYLFNHLAVWCGSRILDTSSRLSDSPGIWISVDEPSNSRTSILVFVEMLYSFASVTMCSTHVRKLGVYQLF